jgi:hypothetical protein
MILAKKDSITKKISHENLLNMEPGKSGIHESDTQCVEPIARSFNFVKVL